MKTFKYSQLILSEERISKPLFLMLLFSSIAILIRTQILPIIMLWFIIIALKKNTRFALLPTIVVVMVFFLTPLKDEYLAKISLQYIQGYKEEAAAGLGFIAYSNLIVPESLGELISSIPFLFVRFMLSPFPWNLSHLQYTFAYLDALYILLLLLMVMWRIIKKQIWSWNLILYTVLFIVTFGIFEIAFSGAARHRMSFAIILLPLIIPAKSELKTSKLLELS